MSRRLDILVVDDNRSAADALARVLRKRGDDVVAVYDGQSAIERLTEHPPDLVLTDLKMEPVDGMAVLKAARALRPPVEVIVFTAFGAVDVAVRAMRNGARDFLTKPVTVDQVSARLDDLRSDQSGVVAARPRSEHDFIAEAPVSKRLFEELRRAAGVPSPVWLEGEIGTGRGHAALTLHRLGDPDAPFVHVNVGRRDPWPEKGTAVISSVDSLPDDLQAQLYRDLEMLPPGVQVITTAGPDGRRLVAEGKLRSELYYALAVVVIRCPPLRERSEDVVPLLEMALNLYATRYGRPRPTLSSAQTARLGEHTWPGNIRELLNLCERAVVMGAETFDLDVIDAPSPGLPKLEPGFSLSNYLESIERQVLVEALRKSNGDRTLAGRLLGVERNTLRYKLNKYGLLDR